MLGLCLTIYCNSNINAMENEMESMQTRIDRVKRSLNKRNINTLKMFIPSECIEHLYNTPKCPYCMHETNIERTLTNESKKLLRLIDNIQTNFNNISSLKTNIISNINYLRKHGAPEDICDEIEEFINSGKYNGIDSSELMELANQKLREMSEYLFKEQVAWQYDAQNRTYGASQFLDLKDNIIQLIITKCDLKTKATRMWELKTDILICVNYLKNNCAPEDICDEITEALSQYY